MDPWPRAAPAGKLREQREDATVTRDGRYGDGHRPRHIGECAQQIVLPGNRGDRSVESVLPQHESAAHPVVVGASRSHTTRGVTNAKFMQNCSNHAPSRISFSGRRDRAMAISHIRSIITR